MKSYRFAALVWEALTAKQRVEWLPGDEFEAKRPQGMQQ